MHKKELDPSTDKSSIEITDGSLKYNGFFFFNSTKNHLYICT